MQALKIFHSLNWDAKPSNSYFDEDENKTREIDISAYHPSHLYSNETCCVYNFFFISAEVKKSKNPWIVFRYIPKEFLRLCAWNNIISTANLPCSPMDFVTPLTTNSLFTIKGWLGTGIHEAFKDPNSYSAWYSAFIPACKAAEDQNKLNEPKGKDKSDNILKDPTRFNFFQPVVILDGTLLIADLAETGEIEINETDSAPFEFDFKTNKYTRARYRVDLVTLHGLEKYLQLTMERQQDINNMIKKSAAYAFKA